MYHIVLNFSNKDLALRLVSLSRKYFYQEELNGQDHLSNDLSGFVLQDLFEEKSWPVEALLKDLSENPDQLIYRKYCNEVIPNYINA